MELLLNLAWVLLAVSAYGAWRTWRTEDKSRSSGSLQCLLALGCMLVVLFPVISATDDLRAMRAEIEESPASKRNIRQSSCHRSSLWNGLQNPAACTPNLYLPAPGPERSSVPALRPLPLPVPPSHRPASRAPPFSYSA